MTRVSKLLICTQAVDALDPILGFFHRWIEEFAEHADKVIVLCLRKGTYHLPSHVEVISLGERHKLLRALELCSIAFGRRREYDTVFVHMNPEYVVAAGWLWRLLRKRVGLWYVHKMDSWRLRFAARFANTVFSVAPESIPLTGPKVHFLGHGIDVPTHVNRKQAHALVSIAAVGRIAPIKYLDRMFDVCAVLHTRKVPFIFSIVGSATNPEEVRYEATLRARLEGESFADSVRFVGPLPHKEIPKFLETTDVLLNLTPTGSFDKVILEAMSVGVTPIICNEAFADAPGVVVVSAEKPELIADAIVNRHSEPEALERYVRENHSLQSLVGRIIRLLS
ncbi:MAG TPA: glycosyltransferase [Pyrinomonadaceae bacterium]|jgi:glycosyltransferase involved in cell wall biosynthesis|nr:glycosyltransferase [Pyrinomonadaceae bacterium]